MVALLPQHPLLDILARGLGYAFLFQVFTGCVAALFLAVHSRLHFLPLPLGQANIPRQLNADLIRLAKHVNQVVDHLAQLVAGPGHGGVAQAGNVLTLLLVLWAG